MTKIKSFVPITEDSQYVRLDYEDNNQIVKENKKVVGYGVIVDEYENEYIEPFYFFKDEGIICPTQDATNLVNWVLL